MKTILLIGLGRFGRHIVMKLNELKHQVMAVDQNEDRSTPFYPLSQMHRSGTAPARNFLRILACGILMCALLPLETIFRVPWRPPPS